MECICINGTSIHPLLIFKKDNLISSWISKDVASDWFSSCNSKRWINNIYGKQWVEKCFDIATQEKANEQYHLLLCDEHDSHISAVFVHYCIDHKIILFLLSLHSSHILQPLNVEVFSSIKTAMRAQLSQIFVEEISRLQKIEWVNKYILTQAKAVIASNIQEG